MNGRFGLIGMDAPTLPDGLNEVRNEANTMIQCGFSYS